MLALNAPKEKPLTSSLSGTILSSIVPRCPVCRLGTTDRVNCRRGELHTRRRCRACGSTSRIVFDPVEPGAPETWRAVAVAL